MTNEQPSGGSPREITWLPLAAAAVVAVVIVGLVVLLRGSGDSTNTAGQNTTSSGALACPRVYQQAAPTDPPWVPAKARGGTGDKAHLVPDLIPEHVVVCAYLGGRDASPERAAHLTSTGHRELRGNLGAVIDTLIKLPKRGATPGLCADYITKTDGDDYLIGITFAGGTVWVSAPGNHCVGSSNGSFVSSTNLRGDAAAAYAAGHWVPD